MNPISRGIKNALRSPVRAGAIILMLAVSITLVVSMLALEYGGVPAKDRKERAIQLLDEVGVEGGMQLRKPGKLSGGQQQRVSIARALANQPAIILADEPTGNLDSTTGKKIFDLLHKLSRTENATIIAVTHDLDIAGKTDRTFKLRDGKLQQA